jgi:hypothetical protein
MIARGVFAYAMQQRSRYLTRLTSASFGFGDSGWHVLGDDVKSIDDSVAR